MKLKVKKRRKRKKRRLKVKRTYYKVVCYRRKAYALTFYMRLRDDENVRLNADKKAKKLYKRNRKELRKELGTSRIGYRSFEVFDIQKVDKEEVNENLLI